MGCRRSSWLAAAATAMVCRWLQRGCRNSPPPQGSRPHPPAPPSPRPPPPAGQAMLLVCSAWGLQSQTLMPLLPPPASSAHFARQNLHSALGRVRLRLRCCHSKEAVACCDVLAGLSCDWLQRARPVRPSRGPGCALAAISCEAVQCTSATGASKAGLLSLVWSFEKQCKPVDGRQSISDRADDIKAEMQDMLL